MRCEHLHPDCTGGGLCLTPGLQCVQCGRITQTASHNAAGEHVCLPCAVDLLAARDGTPCECPQCLAHRAWDARLLARQPWLAQFRRTGRLPDAVS